MRLVEARRPLYASEDLKNAHPFLAGQLGVMQANGLWPGVWEDGGYYLFGTSHFDEVPEAVALVLTPAEYAARSKGCLKMGIDEDRKRMRRAQRMYPKLFLFSGLDAPSS